MVSKKVSDLYGMMLCCKAITGNSQHDLSTGLCKFQDSLSALSISVLVQNHNPSFRCKGIFLIVK